MGCYLRHISAVLEIASRNVQRKLGAVENAAEHQQIFGYYFLYVVRNEYLIVIELHLSLDALEFALYLREIEDSLEVERVVGAEVNVEKRLAVVGEHLFIELAVILFGTFRRLTEPKRIRIVDRLFFLALLLFVLFVAVRDLLEEDRHGHERAVLAEDLFQLISRQVFLTLLGNMHDNRRAALVKKLILGAAVGEYLPLAVGRACPLDGGRARIRTCIHINGVAHHERRIEAETEVTDYAVARRIVALLALVFLDKVERSRQCYLAEVFSELLLVHSDSVIGHGDRLLLTVEYNLYFQ